MTRITILLIILTSLCSCSIVWSETDPNDFAVLQQFRKGLDNPEVLSWPSTSTDPCGDSWKDVFCHGSRITKIQTKNLQLSGTLPQDLNKLTELTYIDLKNNKLSGSLPSFAGLSRLEKAYLGDNDFNTIPSDFFNGLTSLLIISLERNSMNKSSGWSLSPDLKNSPQLTELYLSGCNIVGSMPYFLGRMGSLLVLDMSHNSLTGQIPPNLSALKFKTLKLNNQNGSKLSGRIDVVASLPQLTILWLHGNAFTGPIPNSIGACTKLEQVLLNDNQFVGLIPNNLTTLPELEILQLENNALMGPIPKVDFDSFTFLPNSFCQSTPREPCSPGVSALLNFLESVNYPLNLATSWIGNDPCASWFGVTCSSDNEVIRINLSNLGLSGRISPSLGKLDSLVDILLGGNNLIGTIPDEIASLPLLRLLNISDNDIEPPVPKFSSSVKLLVNGNPKFDPSAPPRSPPESSPINSPNGRGFNPGHASKGFTKSKILVIVVPIVVGVLLISLVIMFLCHRRKAKKATFPRNAVTIAIENNGNNIVSPGNLVNNLVISVQVLRNATNNFSAEKEVGRGGFGVVYRGELHDGTKIAVKRMESGVLSYKAFDEFENEIAVLSKVRHRNVVSLLGFSAEGNEKLLVYEYMAKGALSKHLFHREEVNLEPLSWKRRLYIALDVARAMEYLHSLAHQSFIHRDIKSSNILLDDDYLAKVSDFGLAKLVHDGKYSVVSRLAGTFGYLAPEYAVTGKVTTKCDVFSYGVVLIELLTGMTALDEDRPEETRHLASWFYHIKSDREKLRNAMDKSLEASDENFEEIFLVAELAGRCISREAQQRPDMGHTVNVLAPLVDKWKPVTDELDESLGMDLGQPQRLLQMVKDWQDADGKHLTSSCLDDSRSIPSRPLLQMVKGWQDADGKHLSSSCLDDSRSIPSRPLLQMVKGWQDADGKHLSSSCLDDSRSIPSRPPT